MNEKQCSSHLTSNNKDHCYKIKKKKHLKSDITGKSDIMESFNVLQERIGINKHIMNYALFTL